MRAMLLILMTLVTAPALAHPGEHRANLSATLWHLLSEPDHLALLALALVVGVGGAVLMARRAP